MLLKNPTMDTENKIPILGQFPDIDTQLKEHIILLEQYKEVVDESNIVSKTNPKGIITYINSKFEEISGYTAKELLGKPHNIIRHPDMPASAFQGMWKTILQKQTWHGIVKNKKKDGGFYYVEATIIPILDSNNKINEYIAIRKDITRLMEQTQQIKKQTTDALTGLPNYNKLAEDAEIAKGKTLILLNIDLFREIIDFYGEEIGNQVLHDVQKKLRRLLKKINKKFNLYKLYGDEYAFFMGRTTTNEKLEELTKFIHTYVNRDGVLRTSTVDIHYSLSIGSYTGVEKYSVNKAKIAMKYARETKKVYYLYDDIIKVQHRENLNSVRMLKHAIAQNKIIPYYQPIVNNKTGKIEKYESLARLIDSDNNILLPESFLKAAKRSKLYPFITMAMLDNVLTMAKNKDMEFSINLSVEDIANEKIKSVIYEALQAYPESQSNIIFEITESENIDNFAEVKDFIDKVKQFGCKIAVDDFGSGYSNFEYLTQLTVDYLKIDGSLIKNIHKDPTLKIIVQAIVNFAKQMNYKTVAEYIHTEEVYKAVQELGIDYSQGYYFGKPLPDVL
ncbi:MAG: EAL domain-containing protein [Leptospirales bacterium]